MRDIASRVRGQTSAGGDSGDSIRTPALDRLLFLFLKLLMTQAGLDLVTRYYRDEISDSDTEAEDALAMHDKASEACLIDFPKQ